jgi:hypothetical protein
MNRAEAEKFWAEAEQQADMAVRGLEALAKAALCGLYVLAMSPGDKRTKLSALGTLLAFIKAKPAERRAISKANNPTEEWLQSVLQADT